MMFVTALACAVPLAPSGGNVVESFSAGNASGWTFGAPNETVQPSGGNPLEYLCSGPFTAAAPRVETTMGNVSNFHGDFRTRGVTSFSLSVITFADAGNGCRRPITLMLTNDNGTPGQRNDDCRVYTVTQNIAPCPGDGWQFAGVFPFPSSATTLPADWVVLPPWDSTPDLAWNVAVTDTDQLAWIYGDPGVAYAPSQWELGVDQFTVTSGNAPATYCTGKTNSLGCVPIIRLSGAPSTTLEVFSILADDVLPNQPGLLLYGFQKNSLSFHGGTLCIKAPIRRAFPLRQAKASAGTCSGELRKNFNNTIQSGSDPSLTAGQRVNAQWRTRDPGDPAGFGDGLTNAVSFLVCP